MKNHFLLVKLLSSSLTAQDALKNNNRKSIYIKKVRFNPIIFSLFIKMVKGNDN